jgi:hypothetical protein
MQDELRRFARRVAEQLRSPPTIDTRSPEKRLIDAALEHIRDHYGEALAARARRARDEYRRAHPRERPTAADLHRASQAAERRTQDIEVGDVGFFGDTSEWRVKESRAAGEGRYVLVVER